MLDFIPENLDFDVAFEPTKLADKKYVINATTGDYVGIVGNGFKCASHGDFFRGVWDTVTEEMSHDEVADADFKWRTARSGAWAMLDVTLPNMRSNITTDKHETSIGNRIISLHGIDGSCSNQSYFGAIDFFCTNGMINGDYDKIRKKNTSNFTLDGFIYELSRARANFYDNATKMQVWANTSTKYVDVKSLLDDMISSKRKSEKMYQLYSNEVSKRGHNKFALYSAFTNYASYADDRNGFALKNTGNDTQAVSMWGREQEVSKWVSDPRFAMLEAA
jgi:hypothetical protein|tara:strand:+ start:273 stop:1103 length:831 start_codon:yes stop_codon:yes gene_type:complete